MLTSSHIKIRPRFINECVTTPDSDLEEKLTALVLTKLQSLQTQWQKAENVTTNQNIIACGQSYWITQDAQWKRKNLTEIIAIITQSFLEAFNNKSSKIESKILAVLECYPHLDVVKRIQSKIRDIAQRSKQQLEVFTATPLFKQRIHNVLETTHNDQFESALDNATDCFRSRGQAYVVSQCGVVQPIRDINEQHQLCLSKSMTAKPNTTTRTHHGQPTPLQTALGTALFCNRNHPTLIVHLVGAHANQLAKNIQQIAGDYAITIPTTRPKPSKLTGTRLVFFPATHSIANTLANLSNRGSRALPVIVSANENNILNIPNHFHILTHAVHETTTGGDELTAWLQMGATPTLSHLPEEAITSHDLTTRTIQLIVKEFIKSNAWLSVGRGQKHKTPISSVIPQLEQMSAQMGYCALKLTQAPVANALSQLQFQVTRPANRLTVSYTTRINESL
jgi:hypothetical protein